MEGGYSVFNLNTAVFKLKMNADVSHINKISSQQDFTLLFDQPVGHHSLAKLTREILPSQWISSGSSYLHQVRAILQIPILDVCVLTGILPRPFELMSLGFLFQTCLWFTLAPCSSPMALLCFVLASGLSHGPGLCLFWAMNFKQMESFIWKNHGKLLTKGLAF